MGSYLSSPITEKNLRTGENDRVSFASAEMQGWRNTMEDARLVNLHLANDAMCFGVFDGHGGKEVAIFVERHFCSELEKSSNYQAGRVEQSLRDTFLQMDRLLVTKDGQRELTRIQKDLPETSNSTLVTDSFAGCTAIVALIRGKQLYVANAGDSRCVLAEEGKAVEMSHDHKPDLQGERTRILRAGGHVEDGRVMGNINLSRSIGDMEYKRNPALPPEEQMITAFPDVITKTLSGKSNYLILACDGIWDMLTCQQCVDIVYDCEKMGKSLAETVEIVLNRCLAKDVSSSGGLGCDNMTMILAKLNIR
jgi:serine/threonine protein phosphatase PrpC